jgi:hypothetical protein
MTWVPVGTIRGPAGPPGPAGVGGIVHVQSSPASTWTFPHDLGRVPHSVTIYIDDQLVLTDTTVDSVNVVVEFPSPQSGEVHVL